MIGLNDWGVLPNPGTTGRQPHAVEVYEPADAAVGVPEGRISNKYVRMMEEIWEEIGGKYYTHP